MDIDLSSCTEAEKAPTTKQKGKTQSSEPKKTKHQENDDDQVDTTNEPDREIDET